MILLDIEGTTTPIAFVTDVLFPYARTHIPGYLARRGDAIDGLRIVERLEREYEIDRRAGAAVPAWSPAEYAAWLMDRDRKSPALKELQGLVWEEGYETGDLVGQVFSDVAPALERWRAVGIPVGIFSSGSVLAQQWLLRRSSAGDLTPLIQRHFDTGMGPKHDPESYTRIAGEMQLAPEKILFVSDVVRELDAARDAGMRTVMTDRPGNAPQPPHDHRVIESLEEITGPSA